MASAAAAGVRAGAPVDAPAPSPMIRMRGLGRRFGDLWAVRGVLLAISAVGLRLGTWLFAREAILTRWK
jgi:hypothetical protein